MVISFFFNKLSVFPSLQFRDDPRLRRLATAAAESKEDAAAMRREIRRAEIIKAQIDELKAEAEDREKQELDEGDGKAREIQVS